MRRLFRFTCAACVIAIAVLVGMAFPLPLCGQRVELRIAGRPAPDTVSLFVYDTLYTVEAVALDTRGRKAPSAKPELQLHMWDVARLQSIGKAKGNIAGVGKGIAFAVGNWLRSDGRVLTDTLWIRVPRARAIALEVCFDFSALMTDQGMIRNCVTGASAPVGQSVCVYVTAKDRMGGYITGVEPQLSVSDAHVAKLSSDPVCPDTTVNPYKLNYPLPRPHP